MEAYAKVFNILNFNMCHCIVLDIRVKISMSTQVFPGVSIAAGQSLDF